MRVLSPIWTAVAMSLASYCLIYGYFVQQDIRGVGRRLSSLLCG